jgi:CheY-like chemotaxis protein
MRLLLVNYDRDANEALGAVFADEGWETLVATGTEQAIAVLEGDAGIDLVLLRQVHPNASAAHEFLQEKARRPAITARPVIVTSAYLRPPEKIDGVVGLLREPLEIEAVLAAVKAAVK